MSAILIMLGVYLATFAGYWGVLALAARWLKFGARSQGRLAAMAVAWLVVTLGEFVLMNWISDRVPEKAWRPEMVALVLGAGLEVVLIQMICRTTLGRALGGWGMTMGIRIVLVVIVLLAVRGPLVEAFRTPALSMAPTFMGRHAETTCTKCGGKMLYALDPEVLAQDPRIGGTHLKSPTIIGRCINCGAEGATPLDELQPLAADRFFVTKFLTPARWDVITYRAHDTIQMKRLVGLPGEEVQIDTDGRLMIDGKIAAPPGEVAHGAYRWPTIGGRPLPDEQYVLKPGGKLRLGMDEYFVLGDNSQGSLDSRMTGPVKKGDVVGVITWNYWPLDRMRILR
jgi:signal peptidase I